MLILIPAISYGPFPSPTKLIVTEFSFVLVLKQEEKKNEIKLIRKQMQECFRSWKRVSGMVINWRKWIPHPAMRNTKEQTHFQVWGRKKLSSTFKVPSAGLIIE